MTDKTLFFDTYALVEIFKGNYNYIEYSKCGIVTTYLNLFELYFNLKKTYGEEVTEKFFDRIKEFCVPLIFEWIKEASEIRSKNKGLSYADALGYVVSKKLDIKFLTGDNQFKGMENVEFVK